MRAGGLVPKGSATHKAIFQAHRSEAPPHPSFSSSSSPFSCLLPPHSSLPVLRCTVLFSSTSGGQVPSSRVLRLLGPGSRSSPRGLQRELPGATRGAVRLRRALPVRSGGGSGLGAAASDRHRGPGAAPAGECPNPGRGGARVHSSLPWAWSRSRAPRPGQRPSHPGSALLPAPFPTPTSRSGRSWKGPPFLSPQRGRDGEAHIAEGPDLLLFG